MKVTKHEHKGIKFLCRDGFSDEKTFKEVVVGQTYKKKGFDQEKGEHWIDLGGNVGAFAVQAISKGCVVDIYEPDPFNCKMIERNLKLNGFQANIHQKAVVANDQKKMTMYVGNKNQTWRNSLYKNWGNQKFTVPCVHFSEVIKPQHCVKMDIEGSEMPILEAMNIFPQKMVFEWSFDIDPNIDRYRGLMKKIEQNYKTAKYPTYDKHTTVWPNSWFPACANVYCS